MKNLLSLMLSACIFSAAADEGMWQPHQLPQIVNQLKEAGLKLDPNDLTDLTGFPMGAIVSLGGCTASFVSSKGLVVTNHHCAYGSIQYNSTEDNNLLENGFLAKSFDEELQASPGSRIYVTEEIKEVTQQVLKGIDEKESGAKRYNKIETSIKRIVADCESDSSYRCKVVNFHGGLSYYLFKQMTIRDVRLVHAPANGIGKFGGDIDNWMWPRHTGDYSFYRAYVGKDGKPADFSKDNIPYQPKHHLKVNANGVKDGDYIMVLGYPGNTNRYRTALEVRNQFTINYPFAKQLRADLIQTIKSNSKDGSEDRIKYESVLAGLANYEKNYGSMIESYHKGTTQQRKNQLETDFKQWVSKNRKRKKAYSSTLSQLEDLINQDQQKYKGDTLRSYLGYSNMLSSAIRLHRLAIEKQKPDLERKPGYQERDLKRMEQRLQGIDRRYSEKVEKAILMYLLERYAALPASERVPSYDKFFHLTKGFNRSKLSLRLDEIYTKTKLKSLEHRLAWMNKSVKEFESSQDPFIQFAVNSYQERKAIETSEEEFYGRIQSIRPKYMKALISYYKSINKPVYADANSTLRITYGNVKGNSPQDGLINFPFTTLEGITKKETGKPPFNSPKKQLDLINKKHYGNYIKDDLGSVPVNYLGTLDITGGNSGSPTLNDKAEFVGVVFDGVYESIIGDWDYDPKLNRSIHVDSRYMLWVMEHVDGAQNLIDEMDIVK